MIKIRIDGCGGSIAASLIAKALEDAGLKVAHWKLGQDTPKAKAEVTRAATNKRAAVAIYVMPSAQI